MCVMRCGGHVSVLRDGVRGWCATASDLDLVVHYGDAPGAGGEAAVVEEASVRVEVAFAGVLERVVPDDAADLQHLCDGARPARRLTVTPLEKARDVHTRKRLLSEH